MDPNNLNANGAPGQKIGKIISLVMIIVFMVLGPVFTIGPLLMFGSGFELPSFVTIFIVFFLIIWEGILIMALVGILRNTRANLGNKSGARLSYDQNKSNNSSFHSEKSMFASDKSMYDSDNSMFASRGRQSDSSFECPFCGNRVAVNADYCSKCGNKL